MGRELKWEWSDARAGRDVSYALDGSKLADAGWLPLTPFSEGLAATVKWFLANPEWLVE